MRINWKIKSFAFKVIDILHLDLLLYFFQKNITKRSKRTYKSIPENWLTHKQSLTNFNCKNIIEFGAGKSLGQNIFLSKFCENQTVIDVNKMLDFELLNNDIKFISEHFGLEYSIINNLDILRNTYNVNYLAPVDIRNIVTDIKYDAMISTNTLEHISIYDLKEIFFKLNKLLKYHGILSIIIDYSDHYSHTDPTLHLLHFLRYDDVTYEKYYNHRTHYQNRLRHYDYESMFISFGFEILKSVPYNFVDLPDLVDIKFNLNEKSLLATRGFFLLKNI